MLDVIWNDFLPFNTWKPDVKGPKWNDGSPQHLIDESTGRSYWNESTSCVRTKCVLLSLGTPFVHTVASVINCAFRALKVLSFSHFWTSNNKREYSVKTRACNFGLDVARIFATPIVPIALECVSIYGWFRPYDARKLYASIERAYYESPILAPCFQPSPTHHFFGSDPETQNGF